VTAGATTGGLVGAGAVATTFGSGLVAVCFDCGFGCWQPVKSTSATGIKISLNMSGNPCCIDWQRIVA
jgi:hypothetical protein